MAHTVVNYEKTAGAGAGTGEGEGAEKGEGGGGGGDGGGGGGCGGGKGTDGMVETYESEGKVEGHKVWFLCFDQDSHDKLLAAIQEKTGQENPPRLEMDVIDGPKVADGRHRLPREPPELLLSGARMRTIDMLIARDAAEAEQSEQASEHYSRANRAAAMNAARKAASKPARGPARKKAAAGGGAAKESGAGGSAPEPQQPQAAATGAPDPSAGDASGGAAAAFTEDDYYDDDDDDGAGRRGAGTGGAPSTPDGPYHAATTYPDKEAPANIQRRRIAKAGTLSLTPLESDVYDAIARGYGIRASAISYVRKALGEAAHNVSDRDLQTALRELVKKRAIAVQYQTDTARVGSVDGSGERKVNKRVRVYVPVSYADEAEDGGAGQAAAGVDGNGGAEPGDETEADLQGRMDRMMAPAEPKGDGAPMGAVIRDDDSGDGRGHGTGSGDGSGNAEADNNDDEGDAAGAGGGVEYDDEDKDEDEDGISTTKRERVDHGMDLASIGSPTLITMLNDAGFADMREAIRAELDRRKG